MHILSAGIYRYTSDMRFQVIHPEKSENWTLQIKSPQERDSGVYECQVSTEPKMSLNYSLNVVGECILNYSTGYVSRQARVHFHLSMRDLPVRHANLRQKPILLEESPCTASNRGSTPVEC